jgi:hypothetical protein
MSRAGIIHAVFPIRPERLPGSEKLVALLHMTRNMAEKQTRSVTAARDSRTAKRLQQEVAHKPHQPKVVCLRFPDKEILRRGAFLALARRPES